MKSITQQLNDEYKIKAAAGKKTKCPFCGHHTFSITPDDSLGKCFHPSCGKCIAVHSKGGDIKLNLSLLLEEIFEDFHNELMILKGVCISGKRA